MNLGRTVPALIVIFSSQILLFTLIWIVSSCENRDVSGDEKIQVISSALLTRESCIALDLDRYRVGENGAVYLIFFGKTVRIHSPN